MKEPSSNTIQSLATIMTATMYIFIFLFLDFQVQVATRARHTASLHRQFAGPFG